MIKSVAIYSTRAIEWQTRYARHAEAGLTKHGVKVVHMQNPNPVKCDAAIVMGPNRWKAIEQSGMPYLMFNRKLIGNDPKIVHKYCAVGWDGFNGRATFCVDSIDPKRVEKFISLDQIEHWHYFGEHLLMCEQTDTGRCTDYANISHFYKKVMNDAPPGVEVKLKRKPVGEQNISAQMVRKSFEKAKALVVLNSTISIEALLAGYPVVSYDIGDPAWPLASHTLEQKINYPEHRLEFFQYLAHCQWSEQEIASGEFWDVLKEKKGKPLHQWRTNYGTTW